MTNGTCGTDRQITSPLHQPPYQRGTGGTFDGHIHKVADYVAAHVFMGEDDGLVCVGATLPFGSVAFAWTLDEYRVYAANLQCVDLTRDAVLQLDDLVQSAVLYLVRHVVAHLPCLGVLAR